MKNRYTSLLLPALLIGSLPITAQVSFGGHPHGLMKDNGLPVAPLMVMPEVDAEALKAEDAQRELQGVKGPYRFGFNHLVDFDLFNSGVWSTLGNGDRIWRLAIECPGAFSINFEFNDYVVPEGAQVFVYNEAGEVLGSFEEGSNPGHTELGVTQLAGDRITIEYVEPLAVRGQGRLRVGQVTHAYRDIMGLTKGLGDSGSCNNNVICPVGDNWRAQIRAVAMITVGGQGLCTGQLINNCDDDGTPYFITANHCLGGSNTWVFRFNWQSPVCASNSNGPTNQTVSGSTLLASSGGSDVGLLQLNSVPPASYNVYYTGWDKSGAVSPSVTCIHHPSGDIKKISFENNPVSNGNFGGASCWHISAWDDGTTEPGSSGSGLWNNNGLFIGQLYGGEADCSNNVNDYFGRFSVSYPLLATWLGSCGNTHPGYPQTVGMDEVEHPDLFSVLPNPTNGLLNVTIPAAVRNDGKLVVYDALGQVVISNTLNGAERTTIDLDGRTEGIYLVELVNGSYRAVERVVLTR
ncbi:MAG: T9SS type A sorting domain-containing protein [Flavobacteriales bacterium]